VRSRGRNCGSLNGERLRSDGDTAVYACQESCSIVALPRHKTTKFVTPCCETLPPRLWLVSLIVRILGVTTHQPFLTASGSNTTAAAATSATRRSLATVADPPVRRYGGLKDQDRIFTNLFCRGDHGIKGAQVSFSDHILLTGVEPNHSLRLEVTGTRPRRSFSRATHGSSSKSRIPDSEAEVVPDSHRVSSGHS
jgi:hypothetical protein